MNYESSKFNNNEILSKKSLETLPISYLYLKNLEAFLFHEKSEISLSNSKMALTKNLLMTLVLKM
jgi:hypothetical protein